MYDTVIKVENLSKRYRLGEIGFSSIRDSAERLWHRLRGRKPGLEMSRVGEAHAASEAGSQSVADDIWALRDVSFDVKRGEVLGIIGKNGAGKSTLLKILTRITEPTTGMARMRGRVASLLEVGTGFHPELTGRENVYLNGAILGMSRAEVTRKLDQIVSFAEVDPFLDTPVKRYSSGMYVRLAFAVAAHLDPDIFLIDEVLAVGDIAFQKKCLGKMGEIASGGRTVLFVSHNMGVIREVCDTCILVDEGRKVSHGKASDVSEEFIRRTSSFRSHVELADPDIRVFSTGWSRRSLFCWSSASLANSRGERTARLRLGEPFCVRLTGFAESNIEDLKLGLAVRFPGGQQIIHSIHIDDGLSTVVGVGWHSYECKIEHNVLLPGIYELGVGARGTGVSEYIPVALTFRVDAVDEDGRMWDAAHDALVKVACHWSEVECQTQDGQR